MTLDQQASARGMRPHVLYISYNSLIEPLGTTQVTPYVRALARTYEMTVLSYEKPVRSPVKDQAARHALEIRLRESRTTWIRLPYHKSPSLPATGYDIAAGLRRIALEHRSRPFDLVHARGYVPSAIAWAFKRRTGTPFLFDIRGLQAEEYADAGHWNPHGLRYRLTKIVEQQVLSAADGLVTLTSAIQPALREFPGLRKRPALPPWDVIPSCVDLEHFCFTEEGRRGVRDGLAVGDRPVLVYAGSVGTWYLLDEMLDFFTTARAILPDLFFLFLANGRTADVEERMRRHGIDRRDAVVRRVGHDEMPAYLSAADAGIAFIRTCFSKLSSSPTKYAEYLACGLPLVINAGVGDADRLVTDDEAGVLVPELRRDEYRRAAHTLQQALGRGRAHYRAVAEGHFSLEERACPAYRALYDSILVRRPRRRVLFLTPYPLHCAPSQRLKFEQYYRFFEDNGIKVVASPFVAPALWRVYFTRGNRLRKLALGLYGYGRRVRDFIRASRYDAVYVHLWAVPLLPPWFEEALRRRGIPLVYDIDDLIYRRPPSTANPLFAGFRRASRVGRIITAADHVIVATRHLAEFAAQHNPRVTVISSTIDTDLYYPREHSRTAGAVTIGWSGSYTTALYLRHLIPVLQRVARLFPIRLLVIGAGDFSIDGVMVESRPWTLQREVSDLAEMDIGVYPVPNEEFALGKSGLKALQYMGMGVPVVASKIGSACEFIRDGENGFLTASEDEWVAKLTRLILEPPVRARMGLAGRRTVEERFSVKANATTYFRVVTSVFPRDARLRLGNTQDARVAGR
ncbi:MAG: hypothetical protein A3I61_19790 [Acidobacteria bacterium RIFCSPLOWO2_02_FULL_68_18]|nr:MAG: hypothetical protein A3I61_19790 [Acidobacteria bacterium RIFCSPLOWO2_02_FULL_68_18]OFW48292.1 MAG: hypothetical protein A3G77_03345 [Acidobacteria bacterium RIFCSPLOWO2_12_FULL_68_19]